MSGVCLVDQSTVTFSCLVADNGGQMMMGSLVEAMNVSQAVAAAAAAGRLELTTEYFLLPTPSAAPCTPAPPPAPPAPGILRRDMWVAPLLIFSSLTMILIALFEVGFE